MAAKSGVARLALATGVPVIPAAHWGAQRILPYGSAIPKIIPRKRVQILVGPPVDLSEFQDQPITPAVLREATAKIMADITGLLAEIRHEEPPVTVFHPAVARRQERQELRKLAQASEAAAGDGNSHSPGITQPAAEPDAAEAPPA
jgi:1-acyl-sn-glycerol-3-phosphate acyltransferase